MATMVCKYCEFKKLCEELEYALDCEAKYECEHYSAYLEGMETVDQE